MKRVAGVLVAWVFGCACAAHGEPAGEGLKPFHIEQRWAIGGEGSWDYMLADSASHRLYLAHQTKVDVVDLTSGKLVGSISGLTRCHGIVILPDGKTGFISDGGANRVVVFDPANLATLGTIDAGTNPDGMVYEGSTKTLWAFNGASKNASVIDVASRKVVATLAMPGKPEFPATDHSGTIWVNIETTNSVVRLDARARKITATWPLKGCESPSGLALDREGGRLFSVCDGNAMAVTDARTGKNLAVAKVGDGPDATAYDAKSKLAFASNEDGTLSVVDAGKPGYPTIQTLPTMQGARTMALDAATGTVYTVSAKLGTTRPAPTALIPHPRLNAIPGSFTVMVIGR